MRRSKKVIGWIVISCAALAALGYLGFLGYREAVIRAWIPLNEYDIRAEGTLRVGDLAPDLSLTRADGTGEARLSEYWQGKPLVLTFGSYT